MIRVGIMGCGGVAVAHADAIRRFPSMATLIAVADIQEERLKLFADRYGVRTYERAEDLLDQSDIDCVLISLPTHMHAEWAVRAARTGKHILLEKPMAITVEECDQIMEAVAGNGVFLSVGQSYRYYDGPWFAKQMVDRAELGDMVFAIGTFSKNWNIARRSGWHLDRSLGGGMWLTNGVHTVNTLQWLTGSPVVAVKGLTGQVFHPVSQMHADDATLALLQHRNGMVTIAVIKGYRRGAPKDMLEITCTEGMIRCERTRLWVGVNEQWQERSLTTEENKVREWDEFLTQLEKGGEPPIPADEARETVRILVAVEQSSATGREIRLD